MIWHLVRDPIILIGNDTIRPAPSNLNIDWSWYFRIDYKLSANCKELRRMEKFMPIESRAFKFWHTKLKSARRSMRSLAKEEGDNKELD